MSLVPPLKVANLGSASFTVNSFLLYLRLTVKIFQFLRLSTKFLAVVRLSVNPIGTLTEYFTECPRLRYLIYAQAVVVSEIHGKQKRDNECVNTIQNIFPEAVCLFFIYILRHSSF